MRFLRVCLLIITLFTFMDYSKAQNGSGLETFPNSWAGKWKGDLNIYNATGLAQSVPMELHILPVDSTDYFTWTIIYGPDRQAGLRPYLLKPVDQEKGVYSIDEQNTIVMENFLLGNKLYGRFEVMGNLLLSTVEKPNRPSSPRIKKEKLSLRSKSRIDQLSNTLPFADSVRIHPHTLNDSIIPGLEKFIFGMLHNIVK